jgi:ATP-binding cassette subfamily E protein 1
MSQTNRIAIIDPDRCKPTLCRKECINVCPPQSNGKQVIQWVDIEDIGTNKLNLLKIVNKKKIARIIESLCIGCNACVKKCPFDAIKIVNLPVENKAEIVHRYGFNGFRLYKLPILKTNSIIGIIGSNGVGKTTIVNILSGLIVPNFESVQPFDIKTICTKYRGTVLHEYLKNLYSNKFKISIKRQKIKDLAQPISVQKWFDSQAVTLTQNIIDELELNNLMLNNMNTLSGGELQRVLCACTLCSNSDVYIFDEPSNYLDIKQRLTVTKLIRNLASLNKYVVIIEHDLAILDFVADEIFIIYGKPGAFGIVSNPLTTLEAINIYLDGYIPNENIRFRSEEFNLKPTLELENIEQLNSTTNKIKYPAGTIEYSGFTLIVPDGVIDLSNSLNVILGPNGYGKTTFIKYLAKSLSLNVSYKEQTLDIEKYKNKSTGEYPTVNELFYKYIMESYIDSHFVSEVIKPLDIDDIKTRNINELSGGELQKILIILCLGKSASIYLIDEPSANLDIEKRLTMIKIIKRFIINNNKCGFIIEHDIMMAVSFAQEVTSKIILIEQVEQTQSSKICKVSDYMSFRSGINNFLQNLNITMRISGHNRPRINKIDSQLDQEQKESKNYYA